MSRPVYPLRRLSVKHPKARRLSDLPNFGPNGNLTGMRSKFGWDTAAPVKCGAYVYNCISDMDLYYTAS